MSPQLEAVRVGRNFVRVGDRVHVRPSKPGRRDGFDSRVLAIHATTPVTVDVRQPSNGGLRTLPVERIQRRRQS